MSDSKPPQSAEREPVVGYVHTEGFPEFLRRNRISFTVSTYQAQRTLTFSGAGPRLSMLMRVFERPTGLAMDEKRMALVARNKIWLFQVTGALVDASGNALPYDIIYTPKKAYVTGDISGHEIAWINEKLVFINTRFSCLATVSEKFSFEPIWRPKFVTALQPEDRCHLNGFASASDGIKFLTALGKTDTPDGWRENKSSGGVVVSYPDSEIVSTGLSMPHSPRLYRGKLWVLESGLGELQTVDLKTGQRTTVARLPGYLRGLTFFDRYAFIGLCKIRETNTFGGMKVAEMYPELQCAVYVVDIERGEPVEFVRFTKGIEELFDIQVLPGFINPHLIGFEEATIDGVFILP